MNRLLDRSPGRRPTGGRCSRSGQLGLGAAAFALLIAGWTATLVLAITPLVVPLLIGLRIGVGSLAAAEASLARNLLGVDVRPRISTPGVGFWSRGFNVLKDRAFWKQQAHLLMAWPLALLVLAPLSWALSWSACRSGTGGWTAPTSSGSSRSTRSSRRSRSLPSGSRFSSGSLISSGRGPGSTAGWPGGCWRATAR